jgi:hypothetical protein
MIAFPGSYVQDGLASMHSHAFMSDPIFCKAYARGITAAGKDYGWHWRVHIGLWAASIAQNIQGDFVECGVNAGFMSSSVMHYLNWNTLGRTFYLLDTFSGIDPRFVSEIELADGILEKNEKLKDIGFYVDGLESVKSNFSEWHRVEIIQGAIPETLNNVSAEQIAFLHIDLNCAPPEVAALEHFWERLTKGAPVLLDDYAYHGYHHQKNAMDKLAKRLGVCIVSFPTGQGMLIKP